MERNSAARAKRRGAVLVALGASAIPILYLAYYIYSFSSALPVNDQWDVAPFIVSVKEGHLNWSNYSIFTTSTSLSSRDFCSRGWPCFLPGTTAPSVGLLLYLSRSPSVFFVASFLKAGREAR